MAVSTAAWYARTPHAFWFLILWIGMTTGSVVGLLPGIIWQLRNRERRPETSGRFIVTSFSAWGLMALVAVLMLAPTLYNEELLRQEFRSLAESEILSIDVDIRGRHLHKTEGTEAISAFVSAARDATLLYRSHEVGLNEFTLTVHFKAGTAVSCEGDVPERHANDVALKCTGALAGEVLIPGGKSWLDETQA
jgi:hypothetical protein